MNGKRKWGETKGKGKRNENFTAYDEVAVLQWFFFFERQSYRGKGKGKKTKRLKGINKYFQPLKGIA